ncbi:hypothetical protein NDU88_005748 [Pleurodeles waltl]|uniref:Uncharacterized protein n=1 Tax=Pleurodeles waltl TaxID=8319 RepID=A0AAV7PJS4_PLEWA|nr:hypothetical protein NDU88_005748 [Pleurodeles waltl]
MVALLDGSQTLEGSDGSGGNMVPGLSAQIPGLTLRETTWVPLVTTDVGEAERQASNWRRPAVKETSHLNCLNDGRVPWGTRGEGRREPLGSVNEAEEVGAHLLEWMMGSHLGICATTRDRPPLLGEGALGVAPAPTGFLLWPTGRRAACAGSLSGPTEMS